MDAVLGYAGLRDRDLRAEGLFVAEGRLLVERVVNAGCVLRALVADEGAAEEARLLCGSRVPLTVCAPSEIEKIAGFPFHRGLFAIAERPSLPRASAFSDLPPDSRILVLPSITDPGNLGTLLRSALAFGFTSVLLGAQTCDPFNRKALRSSMGAVFNLNVWLADADVLDGAETAGVSVFAAAIENGALLPSEVLSSGDRLALVLGNEYEGIPDAWRRYCASAVQIPVSEQVDSLNVAIAGSILMWELSPLRPR